MVYLKQILIETTHKANKAGTLQLSMRVLMSLKRGFCL